MNCYKIRYQWKQRGKEMLLSPKQIAHPKAVIKLVPKYETGSLKYGKYSKLQPKRRNCVVVFRRSAAALIEQSATTD